MPASVAAGDAEARFALEDKADASFDSLSPGQRQRLALALAFVHQPDILCLDEPTAGLDAQSRRGLHDLIRRLRDEGWPAGVDDLVVMLDADLAFRDLPGDVHIHWGAYLGTPDELLAKYGREDMEQVFLDIARGRQTP